MNQQIIDEAADWLVEFSTGDADQASKKAFDRWLRQSPEHVRVYLEMLPIWDDGAIALPGDPTRAEELIALASRPPTLVALDRSSPARQGPTELTKASPSRMTVLRRPWAIAAAMAVVMVCFSAVWLRARQFPVYSTAVGEQRTIQLSDGSTMELNTQSRVRVEFDAHARQIRLLEGQALFHVARDAHRPFTVSSDVAQVRAVGTVFDVYRRTNGTVVTVVEGRVRIDPYVPRPDERSGVDRALGSSEATPHVAKKPILPHAGVLLSAGEQIVLPTTEPTTTRRTDVSQATAWTQGRLIFESTPLTDVAEEFNRYNERRIVVDGEKLAEFRVNGSFRSSDPSSLLRFLREEPGMIVHETPAVIRISRQ